MAADPPKASPKSHPGDRRQLEFATSDDLQALIVEIFESPEYRPPSFPSVALEIANLTRAPNTSIDEFVAVLQKDPLIVANVLKLAQSALYGTKPQSLQNAVQRLGINALRDIVWQVSASLRLFHVPGYMPLLNRIRTHSIFCAHASRMVAARAGLAAEHAFLCGLLHDMGMSGTLIALAEAGKPPPPLTMLLTAIDAVHERGGGETIARLWQLAPEIGSAIQYHHQYEPDVPHVPVLSAVILRRRKPRRAERLRCLGTEHNRLARRQVRCASARARRACAQALALAEPTGRPRESRTRARRAATIAAAELKRYSTALCSSDDRVRGRRRGAVPDRVAWLKAGAAFGASHLLARKGCFEARVDAPRTGNDIPQYKGILIEGFRCAVWSSAKITLDYYDADYVTA